MPRKIIGVDFGNSQSSITIMTIGSVGKPELLNVGGGRDGVTIPSLLALEANDNSLIGFGNAVKTHYRDPQSETIFFAANFKRNLGQNKNDNLYCKIFINELAEFVKNRFNLKNLSSEEYATCFAHPATWKDEQISLLKQYALEAGFPVDPDMGIYTIPEPVAAMNTLKVQESLNFRFGNKPEHYMVIDFGGGTLDICVIKTDILGRTPEIVSTAGDPNLGGKEFDEIIEKLFFRNNENIKLDSLSPRETAELNEKFKEAKENFSENFLNNTLATYKFHIERGQYSLTISKEEFSNISKDRGVFEKIQDSIRTALKNAELNSANIKRVILTGGSSKWYFMREIIAKEFSLGGESIYLTDAPFTDVANGCAIYIGRPDSPPERKGIWVRFKINNEEWSDFKCLLRPGRNITSKDEKPVYIGRILNTQYLKAYTISISWWSGFEENNLEACNDGEAIIKFYARSNVPFFEKIKGFGKVLKNQKFTPMNDEYKLYMQFKEDEAGGKTYRFEIMDAEAAVYENALLRLNKEAVAKLASGYRETGKILPGELSYRQYFGLGKRVNTVYINNGKEDV